MRTLITYSQSSGATVNFSIDFNKWNEILEVEEQGIEVDRTWMPFKFPLAKPGSR
jgi:hypothetical protein